MSRSPLLCIVGGLILLLGGVLTAIELAPATATPPTDQAPTQLAARYHLRNRTSNFHARAKVGGSPSAIKTNR